MNVDEQHVLAVGEADQPSVREGPVLKIERSFTLLEGQPLRLRFGVDASAQVRLLERKSDVLVCDALNRLAVQINESSAQPFVPGDQTIQRAAQGRNVQKPAQPQTELNSIRRLETHHMRQQPQALLRER